MKPERALALGASLAIACAIGARATAQRQERQKRAEHEAPAAPEMPMRFSCAGKLLDEVSGLAASARNPAWVWAHEDSGNAAELVALAPNGRAAFRYRLSGARNFDWEDMCVARRRERGTYLVIADVGRNLAKLGQAMPRLWLTPEPALADLAEEDRAKIERATRGPDAGGKRRLPKLRTSNTAQWLLRYEGLEEKDYPDVEALYFDPRTRRFGLVTKVHSGRASVWSLTPPRGEWMREAQLVAHRVAEIHLPGKRRDRLITAACFDDAKQRLLLTSYERLLTVEAPALAARVADEPGPRRVPVLRVHENRKLPSLPQVEALTLLQDGSALVGSEGKRGSFARVLRPDG